MNQFHDISNYTNHDYKSLYTTKQILDMINDECINNEQLKAII